MFTLSGDSAERFFETMWPAQENTRSDGTDVAGIHKYFFASFDMAG